MPEPVTLTPEEQQELSQKEASLAPQPINPIRDMNAADLAELSAKDPEFNLVEAFRADKDLWADPATVQKVADAHHAIKQRGFQLSDIPAVRAIKQGDVVGTAKGVVKPVWDIAKGFGKQAWNYASAAVAPVVMLAGKATGQGKDFQTTVAQQAQRGVAENWAGTEQAVTGLGEMGAKAIGKAGRALGISKPLEQYTPEEKTKDLWDSVGAGESSADIASGHGGFLTPVGGQVVKELEESGKPIRPEETAVTAAGDPFSWWAFGKVFHAAGKAVPAAVSRAASAAGETLAQVGGKAVSAAGKVGQVAGAGAEITGKVASVAAPIIGGARALLAGDVTPALFGAGEGMAGASLKRLGEVAKTASSKVEDLGRQITGTVKEVMPSGAVKITPKPVVSPYAQAARDVLTTAPGAALDIGKGAALDLGLGAATSEGPQDTQGLGIGAAFGALGAGRRVGGRVLSGQLIAPRDYGVATAQPSSGQFPALDAMHQNAFASAEPAVKARLNAIRLFTKGAAPGTDIFMGDATTIADALQKSGVSPEQANHVAAQEGFFTTDLPGKDGASRKVIIVKDAAAAPHESFHAIQDVIGEPGNRQIDAIVRKAYAPEWDAQGTDYARRLVQGDLPGTWRETILDKSGWGVDEAKEKIINHYREQMPDATAAEIEAAAKEQLGELTDAALQANSNLTPAEAQAQVWRNILSPTESGAVADRYLARELAAENFDAVFKHTGPAIKSPKGLLPILADKAAQVISAFGGNPLAGRVSEIGRIEPKFKVMKSVEQIAKSRLPEITPRGATKGPKPVVTIPGTPEARSANADAARVAAESAPATPIAGGTRSAKELLGDVAEAIAQGTGIKINYLSAPDEPAAATTSNRETRRAIIETYRTMPPEARALWEKSFFPDRVITTKGGEYQIQGWSPEVFAANAHKMAGTLAKIGDTGVTLSPYEIDKTTGSFSPDGWRRLYEDVQRFVNNQSAGATGSGESLVVPKDMEARGIFKPQVAPGEAAPLDQRSADFINALFNFKLPETPRIQKGKIPLNIAGQEVSAATMPGRVEVPVRPRGTFEGPEAERQGIAGRDIAEVNPVRAEIERAAQQAGVALPSMIEAIQKLNLSNIKEVAHATELPEFRGNTMTLSAGFQPRAAMEPEAIKEAAIRLPNGKIYTADKVSKTHYGALDKAINAGESVDTQSLDNDGGSVITGFLDNAGNFHDRRDAFRKAVQHGQIEPDAWMPKKGELESTLLHDPLESHAQNFNARGRGDEENYFKNQAQPSALAAKVEKMSPEDFMDWTRGLANSGGFTKAAHDLGLSATSQAEVTHLRQAEAAMSKRTQKALKDRDFDNLGILASQGQFFREAAEAAEGTGSAGDWLRKADPNYKPPFPPGEASGQAQPPARNADVNKVAEEYAKVSGRALGPSSYENIDETRLKRIADEYAAAKHDPTNPEVQSAYDALAKETEAQYKAITAAGYTLEPFTGKGEPYKTSDAMVADVTQNKHLYYLPTAEASQASVDNLMLRPSGIEGRPVNDIFRAVHDFFGHAKEGYQFGPRGEYNAWREHSQMYSDEAQPALAAETLAQNAWVNFGPHLRNEAGNVPKVNEPGYVTPAARPFAEQKNIAFQAQPKSKKEKLHPEFWVAPNGKVIPAPSGHYDAALDHILPKDWKPSTMNDPMADLYPDVYDKGYVRGLSNETAIDTVGPALTRAQRDTLDRLSFEHNKPVLHNDRPAGVGVDVPLSGQAQPPKRKQLPGWWMRQATVQPEKDFKMLRGGTGQIFSKAWILPNGRIEQLGGQYHSHWMAEDPAGIEAAKKAGIEVPPYEGGDTEGLRETALQKGFARVNFDMQNGILTIESRAADWPKQKAAVSKLVSANLTDIDNLRVTLLNDTASELIDSKVAKLFELDTDAEKMAAIPFLNDAPRGASMKATVNPAFRAPEEPEAPLAPVYAAPKFDAFDKAGAFVSTYNKYADAEKAAGPSGSVKVRRQFEGQAQPSGKQGPFFYKTFDDALESVRTGASPGQTFNPDGSIWTPPPNRATDIVTLASVNVPAAKLDRESVLSALGPYSDLLDEPGINAGVFSFSKAGVPTVSIDVNAAVDSKHRANSVDFAKQNDQVAIWDATRSVEVPTGGKGDTKLKSVGEITDALDNLRRGKPVDVDEILRQNRPSETEQEAELPGMGKRVLGTAEQSNMTKADLAKHFPESVIPRRRDEPIPSDILGSPLFKEAGNEEAAVKAFSNKLVEFAKEYESDPRYQSGRKWYSEFVPQLKKKFGADAPIMAELLAATSPQNAPESNYAYAVDALHGFKSGRFDKLIAKFEEGLSKLEDGSYVGWARRAGLGDEATPAAFLGEWIDKYNLKPRQSNGQLYGISSVPVLQVVARRWLNNTSGPKTQNFVRNLLGTGHGATIDLWADRTMRRVGYSGYADRWRILPKNATAVSDADFAFSQKAFAAAAKQLGMKPDSLQGALWFAEKAHWNANGWSRLDLGDYRKELPKTAALQAGVAQRLQRTTAVTQAKRSEQNTLDLTVEPRKLK